MDGAGGYRRRMTTTPEEPLPDPEVVPSGDPDINDPDIDPGQDPNLDPQTKPAPDLRP